MDFPRSVRIALPLLLSAAVLAAVPASATALTSRQISAKINKLRTANGIPPLKYSAVFAKRCVKANTYGEKNKVLTHFQTKGKPGYTPDGAWAAMNSPLAQEPWGADLYGGNVWSVAPKHIESILNPYMRVAGGAESRTHYQCFARTTGTDTFDENAPWAPAFRLPNDTLYTFPGKGFQVPWGEQQYEAPQPLTADLGLKGPRFDTGPRTGPTIMMWWVGAEPAYDPETSRMKPEPLQIKAAKLLGPGGAVIPTKFRAASTSETAGYLLPIKPLRPRTTYTVEVALADVLEGTPARTWDTSFRFTTSNMVATWRGVSRTWPND